MILNKFIAKEIIKTQFLIFFVLFAIFFSQSLIRILSKSAEGAIPSDFILFVAFLSLPKIALFILPLTLFIAVLLSIGRMCSDSEMVVIRAMGYSPSKITLIAFFISLVSSGLLFLNSNYLMPYVAKEQNALEDNFENNPTFIPFESGKFITLGRANEYNLYVEDVSNKNNEKSIKYIYMIENPFGVDPAISVSDSGYTKYDKNGVQWLYLLHGKRLEGPFDDGKLRYSTYDEVKIPLQANIKDDQSYESSKTKSLIELIKSDDIKENLDAQWQISAILATIILSIIAVPMAMVNPRQGRFARFFPALLIYASYYTFLISIRSLIDSNTIGIYPGMYIVPLIYTLAVAIPLNVPKYLLLDIFNKKR